jgi:hypothetical protein
MGAEGQLMRFAPYRVETRIADSVNVAWSVAIGPNLLAGGRWEP